MTKKEERQVKETIKNEIEFGFLHFHEQEKYEELEINGHEDLWIKTISTNLPDEWYVEVLPIHGDIKGKPIRVSKTVYCKDVKTYMYDEIDNAVEDVFTELKRIMRKRHIYGV